MQKQCDPLITESSEPGRFGVSPCVATDPPPPRPGVGRRGRDKILGLKRETSGVFPVEPSLYCRIDRTGGEGGRGGGGDSAKRNGRVEGCEAVAPHCVLFLAHVSFLSGFSGMTNGIGVAPLCHLYHRPKHDPPPPPGVSRPREV